MNLISIQFAFFFTIVFIAYWLLQYLPFDQKVKTILTKLFIMAVNLAFCYLGGIRTVAVVLACVIITWFGGLLISRNHSKVVLAVFLVLELLPLLVLKYSPLFLQTVGIEGLELFVPLGISFYTLQSITYLVSVYKDELKSQSLLTTAVFVSFFPILSSGPIARAKALIPQMNRPVVFEYDRAANGMVKIGSGLLKKMVVADAIGIFVNRVYGSLDTVNEVVLIVAVMLYSFQIYFDFSGYSDLAIGLVQLLGFDITENFNKPYLSKTIGEFWRRWHISLSSWFRDYVYIPLGGNRRSAGSQYINVLIVFLLSGLWHGAAWHFVLWGLIHGIVVCLERIVRKNTSIHFPSVVRVIYTFLISTLAWIFFRSETIGQGMTVLKRCFSVSPASFRTLTAESFLFREAELPQFRVAMAVMVILLLLSIHLRKTDDGLPEFLRRQPTVLRKLLYFCIVFIILFYSVKQASSNFIYTGF